jgi:2-polyprenyl-6-methoxyphenol hydroxylase-like FAD-dependent oxidoreductase
MRCLLRLRPAINLGKTMSTIGIVGAGISGVHLALRLQQLGVDTTLYAERAPDEHRAARPVNLVARFGQTQDRERVLDVDHFPDRLVPRARFVVGNELEVQFWGEFSQAWSYVDFRIYIPELVETYQRRGGRVVIEPVDAARARELANRHELMVISSGGRSMAELFPRDPTRSPFTTPQRRLLAMMVRGVDYLEPFSTDSYLLPGAGEIYFPPFYTFGGHVNAFLIEAVPGGPLESVTRMSYPDDPTLFKRTLLELFATHAPSLRERINEREFDLTRPIDYLQGAITPVVRRGWAPLGQGRCAVAIGDAWVLNDPVTGQGANLGSRCAFLLANAISAATRFDESFCRSVESTMWESAAQPATNLNNAFLAPLPPHAGTLFAAAASNQRVANAFVDLFSDPAAALAALSSPAETEAFVGRLTEPRPVAFDLASL